jgi:hypothetical protein
MLVKDLKILQPDTVIQDLIQASIVKVMRPRLVD